MSRAMTVVDRSDVQQAAMVGFSGGAADVGQIAEHGGSVAVVAREEAELKAAIVLARTNPRDEARAYTRIIQSCKRPSFAEGAAYCFPRGGANISGPSVDLAREMARCWGNIRYGLRIVTDDDERVHIKGYAHDLETNAYVDCEDKFAKLIQRKAKGGGGTNWVKPDERDLRELVNRRGAICVRNAILQLLPPDVTDDALREASLTLEAAAKGEIQMDPTTAIRRVALAFVQLGVTTDMIQKKIGHALDRISADELVELRKIYKSMLDGNSRRDEHFPIDAPPEPAPGDGAKSLAERLAAERAAKQAETPPAEPAKPGRKAPEPETIRRALADDAPKKQSGAEFLDSLKTDGEKA